MELIKKRIKKILNKDKKGALSAPGILRRINKEYPMRKEKLSSVDKALRALLLEGAVYKGPDGRYSLKDSDSSVHGVFCGTGKGYGFVTPDKGGRDYFIPPMKTGGAWHGDRVSVKPYADMDDDKNTEAHVEKILSKANKFVTGRVVRTKRDSYLEPDSAKLPRRINIDISKTARTGDKAALRVTSRGGAQAEPAGIVHRIFGKDGTLEASVSAALFNYGIEEYFPDSVKSAAERMPAEIDEKTVSGRLDLRDKLIFTIDGDYAKDIDDAVSIEESGDGLYILGVHIADVSHYVEKGSVLDAEAYERGTSVYFANRVIPMLPAELSNGICSLNPNADRLSVSVIMTIDKTGTVTDRGIYESVIHSKEKMTYNNCNAILSGDPELSERYKSIREPLLKMSELSDILSRRRTARGALEFETAQSVILCGADGRPTDIFPDERGISERIIEEFMLIANETVARYVSVLKKPTIYRVHEKPGADKIASFASVAANFGYKLEGAPEDVTPKKLQAVLNAASESPEGKILGTLMLRSLMRARYCDENLGHFGLAAEYYCHFTSPIRRYPDLVVHRFLKLLISGELEGDTLKQAADFAGKAARQSSERENSATNAEREIEKIYKAEYMSGHIGEAYEGVISGVQPFGVFVELPNSVEGLLPVESLCDGEYYYDESTLCLTAWNGKTEYRIGQSIEVVCAGVSVPAGHVEFKLSGE